MGIHDKNKEAVEQAKELENRDPITGAVGSHPIGTGVGSAGGAVAGAALGAVVGGPVGTVVGGVVGAVVGAATGHVAAEAIDPTVELAYWKEMYTKRPYYLAGKVFANYEPAYRYGMACAVNTDYRGRDWKSIEGDVERGWAQASGTNRDSWNAMRDATHDAWTRANRFSSQL